MDIFEDLEMDMLELATHIKRNGPDVADSMKIFEGTRDEEPISAEPIHASKIAMVMIPRTFELSLRDTSLKWKPLELGFIPSNFWRDERKTFGQMYLEFFRRKNNSNCRFPHKLYNALRLTELFPGFEEIVGVQWVENYMIKVDGVKFAMLLGIKSIEGSLFHRQGNFPTHGFVEVDPKVIKTRFPGFDFDRYRLIEHKDRVFVKGCTERDISQCKWRIESLN